MILPLDLRQERPDVVQIPPGFQPHLVRAGAIGSGSRGILNSLQPGTQRFIHDVAKRRTEFCRNSFRLVQNIVVYGQCRSHGIITASYSVMSRHHENSLDVKKVYHVLVTIAKGKVSR